MSEKPALHLVLEIRWLNFAGGSRPWWKDADLVSALLRAFQGKVFSDAPVTLKAARGGRKWKFAGLRDAAPELVSGGEGIYTAAAADPKRPRSINLFVDEKSLAVELEVWIGPGDARPGLNDLTLLAAEVNDLCLRRGTVGPIFLLRWIDPDYPRPLPPRADPPWPPGTLAFYLSAAHHSQQGPDAQAKFALVRDAPLPQGVVRRRFGDLLAIQAADEFEPRERLESQLYKLEVWIGETFGLEFHKDYLAEGDKRTHVWSKEVIKPFSFYDAATRIGYKVVAEGRDNELDAETWNELEAVLPLRSLPDGRPVKATRVIFVEREAALLHLPRVRALGGSGVLYLGRDGDLWDPDPPGRWVRAGQDVV